MIDEATIVELLRRKGDYLFHREGQEVEFKEQFNLAGLADYFRDFAAFANNRGGYLIFGVKDSPRIPEGLKPTSLDQFDKIDPQKITGYLLEIFSSDIRWEQATISLYGQHFGVFRIFEAQTKPVIAKKDEGKDQAIKSGEIYFRYGGRTQKILFAELENIINRRVEQNNDQWLDLMKKIGRAGPANAAILDTQKALIEKGESQVLVVDEQLASKLKFIREGQFVEKDGAMALKLVGDVVPIDRVEVVQRIRENLIKEYPLSAIELADAIRKRFPAIRQNQVWEVIAENDLKNNTDYSAYNFRNKKQEDEFARTGLVPSGAPSIYNYDAVDFIINVIQSARPE
jgi:hypothetical protein